MSSVFNYSFIMSSVNTNKFMYVHHQIRFSTAKLIGYYELARFQSEEIGDSTRNQMLNT